MASKMRFSEFIYEAPIGDYQIHGDWSKGKSFRDKRDRMLIQNPRSIERMKKKFQNTDYNFNLFFLNSTEANRHTEVGKVDLNYVKKYFGEEMANAIVNSTDYEDSINVIFTNNKGSERMPFTAWIAAHRLGHAFAREGSRRSNHTQYMEASNHLISSLSQIMQYYGNENFPDSESRISYNPKGNTRVNQLTMIHFFQHVATFKSARDKNLRDWFEVLNELIAQYLTTGRIKFNPPPKTFGGRARKYYLQDEEEANDAVQMMARDMEYMIDGIMGSIVGSILVM